MHSFELLMCRCWRSSPGDRPTFTELVTDITGFLTKIAGYIDPNAYHASSMDHNRNTDEQSDA